MLKMRMKAKDIMSKDLKTCLRDTSLHDVAQMMSEADCGAIPVVDSTENLKPVGIITDRDIVNRTLAKGVDPFDKNVGDCLTEKCFTVNEDAGLSQCLETMEADQVRRVVVIDNRGKCRGIVAQADIALHETDGKIAKLLKRISKSSKTLKRKVA